ncbi:Conserved_hypothetical protein [Hexamita inflata]|uniref:Uncharacterized protein n=1 Tax=Hexamita inflata TaxID=28002 RepID=A0AA86PRQ0_9EUKA|nr:Conserved hypothetical protein [Hexamita inflata]
MTQNHFVFAPVSKTTRENLLQSGQVQNSGRYFTQKEYEDTFKNDYIRERVFYFGSGSGPVHVYDFTQEEYDEHQREILKERIFDGELCIMKDKQLRDLNFIDKYDVKKLVLLDCNKVNPEFMSQTVKELHMIHLSQIENFRKIQLENLENLKILHCINVQECHYISQVRKLELFNVTKNVEQLFSNQTCNQLKELIIQDCQINSLDKMQIENVEVLRLKEKISNSSFSVHIAKTLNIENIKMYHQLKELFIEGYNNIDTTPLQQLKNLSTVRIEKCENIIINFNSESFKDVLLNCCIFKSVDAFRLPNIERLGLTNFSAINLDNINQYLKLKELDLSGNQRLNLQQLQELTYITSLNLSGCKLQDFTNSNIQTMFGCKNVDIFQLRFLIRLEKLSFRKCGINMINVVSFLVNLKELDLAENNCNDLAPLQALVKLTKLNLENCKLTNIDSLKALVNLEELNLSEKINGLQDISALQYLTKLITLDMRSCQLSNVHVLKTLTNLKELCINRNPKIDITSLKYLTNLKILNLSQCELSKCDALKTLVNLNELNLSLNLSIDITPLQYLKQLTKLELNQCGLTSIDALTPLFKLKELDLMSNIIVYAKHQLQQLKHLDKLELRYNKIVDLSSKFSEIFDKDNRRPSESLVKYANILKNVNSPVYLLRNIYQKRKNFNNNIFVSKNSVNTLMNKQITRYISVIEKIVSHFQEQKQLGEIQ